MNQAPQVSGCTVTSCSYNNDGCHALAVNVKDRGCTTFISLNERGGLDRVTAAVGACQSADCVHNSNLECAAPAVRMADRGGKVACLTYEAL
nr:DUF1540 domain-containing protein [Actinomyces vulturis]